MERFVLGICDFSLSIARPAGEIFLSIMHWQMHMRLFILVSVIRCGQRDLCLVFKTQTVANETFYSHFIDTAAVDSDVGIQFQMTRLIGTMTVPNT